MYQYMHTLRGDFTIDLFSFVYTTSTILSSFDKLRSVVTIGAGAFQDDPISSVFIPT